MVQYVHPSMVMSMSGSTRTYLHNGHIFIARICWKKGSILLLRLMLFLDVVVAWNDLQKGFAHQPFSQVVISALSVLLLIFVGLFLLLFLHLPLVFGG